MHLEEKPIYSPTGRNNYSLWKASRSVKKPQKHCPLIKSPNCAWAKTDSEKAKAFASNLAQVREQLFMRNEVKYEAVTSCDR
ncbi:unnamed protein product [Leptidea sinapis]|uniref:Uncharacterized protein n=1 Tax=Leptidea sinapis TaxID=189913 RepID=A0A5E4R4B5_9NEOP|nr:unnamed protein product [Leptidea sinapis]